VIPAGHPNPRGPAGVVPGMWPPQRFRPVPDPLVRAAGFALLATCGAWLLVLAATGRLVGLPVGRRPVRLGGQVIELTGSMPPAAQVLVLVVVLVLAGCAVRVLSGSRRPALIAAGLLTVAAAVSPQLLPMTAGLVVVLLMAHRRLAPAAPWADRRPPIWSTDPAVALAGVGSMLVSQAGTVWIVLATPAPGGGAVPVGLLLIAPAVVIAYALGFLRGYPGWAVAAAAQLAVLAALAARAAERAGGWSAVGWVVVDCALLLAVASTYTRLFGEPNRSLTRRE
jgi:hypothetical protein